MKSYFIHDGNQQLGPFSISDLKEKNIQSSTPIWTEEMSDWTTAGELPELSSIIRKIPPPLQRIQSSPFVPMDALGAKKRFGVGKLIGIIALIAVIVLTTISFYNKYTYRPDYRLTEEALRDTAVVVRQLSPEELRAELIRKEMESPQQYLIPTVKMHQNFWDEQVIEGSIMNNASGAVFKDIVIRVSFLSKTGTALGAKNFTIYEIARPGKWVSFKFKQYAPSETKQFSAVVVSAVPKNEEAPTVNF